MAVYAEVSQASSAKQDDTKTRERARCRCKTRIPAASVRDMLDQLERASAEMVEGFENMPEVQEDRPRFVDQLSACLKVHRRFCLSQPIFCRALHDSRGFCCTVLVALRGRHMP